MLYFVIAHFFLPRFFSSLHCLPLELVYTKYARIGSTMLFSSWNFFHLHFYCWRRGREKIKKRVKAKLPWLLHIMHLHLALVYTYLLYIYYIVYVAAKPYFVLSGKLKGCRVKYKVEHCTEWDTRFDEDGARECVREREEERKTN